MTDKPGEKDKRDEERSRKEFGDLLPIWDRKVDKCREYLAKYPNIRQAIRAAEADGFHASAVAWVTAIQATGKDYLP